MAGLCRLLVCPGKLVWFDLSEILLTKSVCSQEPIFLKSREAQHISPCPVLLQTCRALIRPDCADEMRALAWWSFNSQVVLMVPGHGSAPPGQDLQLTSGLFWGGVSGVLPYFPEYCSLQSLWQLFAWLFQCPKSRYLLSAQKSRVWCFLKLLLSVFLLC